MEAEDVLKVISRVPDHAQNPRNHGPLEYYNGHARITGPCGDTMEFWISAQGDEIKRIGFTTTGCKTSHAAGSMTTCLAKGNTIREALSLQQKDVLDALGYIPKDNEHCALLAANTLKAACEDYMKNTASENKAPWGHHTCIDLYNCNPETIRDAEKIKQFVAEMCVLIDMKPFGETRIVHFGEDERVAGFSMTQLIETSLISAHFANRTNTVYLDVFSCKYYDSEKAADFAKIFFEAGEVRLQIVSRI